MKQYAIVLAAGSFLALLGCSEKKDPRDRPGFVDTSDPSKVMKTMTPPPKGKGAGPGGVGPGGTNPAK